MRQFLKQLLASTIGSILGLGLVGFVTFWGLIALLVGLASAEKDPELTSDTILTLDLSQEVRDAPLGSREALAGLLAGQSTDVVPLRMILESLDKAAKDDRIQGVYVSGSLDTSTAGFAMLREVRQALRRFHKESGKPVIAYGVGWSERDYFVASAADQVYLNPYGTLEMNGFSAQGTFWAGALEKYGIGVQVVRVGKFKSAVEPFTQTERSPESRQQLQQLLGSLWTDFLMTVGGDREVDPKKLLAIARSQGIFRGDQASQAKLVDEVAYEDEVLEKLAELAPAQDADDSFEGLSVPDYFAEVDTSDFDGFEEEVEDDEVGDDEVDDSNDDDDGQSPDGKNQESPSATPDPSPKSLADRTGVIPVAQPGLTGQRKVWLNPPTPDDVQESSPTVQPKASPSPTPSDTPDEKAGEKAGEQVKETEAEASGDEKQDLAEFLAEEAPQVAVIYGVGPIVNGRGSSEQIGGDRLAQSLRELRQDKDVAAVVLRLNSRGGSATASEIIAREVELIAEQKPIVISMGDYAASGGYWIAAPASEIIAEPTTITGSIGVFGLLPNVQKLGENNGIVWDSVQTGPLANLGTITRPKSAAELALLQSSVDWIYGQFINKVAEGRDLEPSAVNEIAQGRVWSGRTAKKLGLVDQLGGVETAIARAAELADLGDDWRIEEYPKSKGLDGLFSFDNTSLDSAAELVLMAGARLGIWAWVSEAQSVEKVALAHWGAWRSQLEWLASLNDPNGAYAQSFEAWEVR